MCGSAAQQVALAWLLFRLSGSSALVGTSVLLSQLPILLMAPLGGALADRFDRRALLIATQAAGALQSLLLAYAAAGMTLGVPALLALSLVLGIINGIDVPVRQSLVPRLVERPQDIRSAVALSAACLHLSRLLGPAFAALLLAHYDVWVCFAANAASYAATILVLGAVRLPPLQAPASVAPQTLRAGLDYALGQPALKRALQWVLLTSVLLIPYTVLLPSATLLWSGASAATYAALMSAAGGGAVLAAIVLANFHAAVPLRRAIPRAALAAAVCLVAIGSAAPVLPAAAIFALVALLGFVLTVVVSGSNVLIQQQVPDALRGRVMGLFVMCFNGAAALGNLLWGMLGDRLGLGDTFIGTGLCAAVLVLLSSRQAGPAPAG